MQNVPKNVWGLLTIVLAILGVWGVTQIPGLDVATRNQIIGLILGVGLALPVTPVGAPGSVVPSAENPKPPAKAD